MTPLETLQAKVIQEQQAKIEVLTTEYNELRESFDVLAKAYAELQINKAHNG